jgi:hypothetical protein
MLIPSKDLTLSESILGLSSLIVAELLKKKKTTHELWNNYCKKFQKKNLIYHTFDDFMLSIDFLFMIQKIKLEKDGAISIV